MPPQEWTTKPRPEDVTRLRHAVLDYSAQQGLGPPQLDDVALAITEIVSNAVVHAFRDGSDGTITVGASVDGDELTIRVADDGIGLTPRVDSPGAGLGLTIACHVADRFQIERLHPGTAISLTFAAAA